MSRRIGIAGVLLATTFWLAGCALWEGVGPCYGFGCRAGLMTPQAQQSAQATNEKKSGTFASWFPFAKKHPAPAANSAPTQSPSTSTPPKQGDD